MPDYKRIDAVAASVIEQGIALCSNWTELGEYACYDPSGLSKHVKAHAAIRPSGARNQCGRSRKCRHKDRCASCRHAKSREKTCATCSNYACVQGCDCPDFSERPDCDRLKRYPGVCNGCEKARNCWLPKLYYSAQHVAEDVRRTRSESRSGPRTPPEELARIGETIAPLVKRGQSLPAILSAHPEIRVTYVTLLSYIDKGLVPGVANIDLVRRVRYPKKHKKGKSTEPTNRASLEGRTYDDFIAWLTENPFAEVVELDTVVGPQDGSGACLMTLLFRKSNFMVAFKLDSHDSAAVSECFRGIREALGDERYAEAFRCVLTDNGSEFCDPSAIEACGCRLFYCDPGKSGQKGKIEKNHVELRKVFPKGTDFARYEQCDVNLALRHVNSERRRLLNWNCPGQIARAFLSEKVLALNEYRFVRPDDVNLTPSLLPKR